MEITEMINSKTAVKVLFVLLLILISLSGILSRHLWKPDEPRVAEIGREMWLNRQFVLPTLNREPFLEKPPLYWWVMSASYELFGVSDGSARLPSALFGFLTLLFTYLIGKRVGGEKTGMFAALILATLTEFSIITHRCLVDNALIFFVTMGYYGFFAGYTASTPRGKWMGYELMAVTSGLAFLSKGLVGPGLIVAPPLLVLLLYRDFKELRRVLPMTGVGTLIFILIVTPWIIGLYQTGGWHSIREYLLQNTLGRILPGAVNHYVGGHRHSFFYYFKKLPSDFLPWIAALPAALAFLFHPPGNFEQPVKKGLATALLLFSGGFLLLSLPATKRGLYLVPIYPMLAVVIGGWFAHACGPKRGEFTSLECWTLNGILGVFSLVPLALAVGAVMIVFTGLGPKDYQMTPVIRRLTPLLVLIVPLGLITFLFLASRFLRSVKSRTAPSCAVIFATVLLLLFTYHEGAVRVMDPVKSIRRFPDKIQPFLKGDPPLGGFHLSELTRGMIPFYTGKYITLLDTPGDIKDFLRKHPGGLLVIPAREAETLPADLRAHLTFLTGQDYSRRFKVRLYRLAQTPKNLPSIPPGPRAPKKAPKNGEET